jgi:activating signal cointegrator 1
MKAVSLIQPFATLVAIRAKTYETRSWATGYRGPLAIHASSTFPVWARQLVNDEPFLSVLAEQWQAVEAGFPLGMIIATCQLVACVRTDDVRDSLSERELAFGDYGIGRWVWRLAEVARLPEPLPAKGRLGLWTVPADIAARISDGR